jgi:phage terminase small subunit
MGQGELTRKQRRFVDEYLMDLNATQAAIRAGYSTHTAEQQGARLLGNAKVSAAVQAAQNARSTRVRLTQDDVLRGLHREATWTGEGASHSARVAAWGLIAKHLGMLERRQLDENGEPVARQLFTISIGNGPSPMPLQIEGTAQSAVTVDDGIDSSARLP